MITPAFESFAQSLRILMEAVMRSHSLLMEDPFEASGNIDQGLGNLLNSFHSLYDSAKDEIEFDWYGTVETATILAIRNARHHNFANRIRELYTFHLQHSDPTAFKPYVFVDYPETEDGGDTFDVPISWHDMHTMLQLPPEESRLRASVPPAIMNYLKSDAMNSYSNAHNVSEQHVFFNITPLIVNAAIKFIPKMRPHITVRSTEAKTFLTLFENVYPADTQTHVVDRFSVFLPA